METRTNVGGYDRRARAALAVILSVVSIGAFRGGRRKTGLLAGIGALGFGFTATTQYCGVNDTLDRDTTADSAARADASPGTNATIRTDGESQDAESERAGYRSDSAESLTCVSCGTPIRLGEPRGPNDRNEIVHVGCA